jgi:hypothetical protein
VKVIDVKWKPDLVLDPRWVEVEDVDVEGCWERNVGWMRVSYGTVMIDVYESLGYDSWDSEYERPPAVKI